MIGTTPLKLYSTDMKIIIPSIEIKIDIPLHHPLSIFTRYFNYLPSHSIVSPHSLSHYTFLTPLSHSTFSLHFSTPFYLHLHFRYFLNQFSLDTICFIRNFLTLLSLSFSFHFLSPPFPPFLTLLSLTFSLYLFPSVLHYFLSLHILTPLSHTLSTFSLHVLPPFCHSIFNSILVHIRSQKTME